jgi:hypothetical protein
VLRIFIAFKNPSPRPGLNPRPLVPVASTLTTTPPRWPHRGTRTIGWETRIVDVTQYHPGSWTLVCTCYLRRQYLTEKLCIKDLVGLTEEHETNALPWPPHVRWNFGLRCYNKGQDIGFIWSTACTVRVLSNTALTILINSWLDR